MTSKGKIKFFNEYKGYGFIIDSQGKEVFFSMSDLNGKILPYTDCIVTYKLSKGSRGLTAKQINIIKYPVSDKPKSLGEQPDASFSFKSTTNTSKLPCPSCNVLVYPRLVIKDNEAYKSLCPLCGGTIKEFQTSLNEIIFGFIFGIVGQIILFSFKSIVYVLKKLSGIFAKKAP